MFFFQLLVPSQPAGGAVYVRGRGVLRGVRTWAVRLKKNEGEGREVIKFAQR